MSEKIMKKGEQGREIEGGRAGKRERERGKKERERSQKRERERERGREK